MRTITAIVTVFLFFAAIGRAEVVFTQPSVDLGQLRTGQSLEPTLVYHNRGTAPVDLLEMKGSCACLLPEFAPRRLAPGESVKMHLRINTLSAPPGPQVWRVSLRYREAGQTREAEVMVKAMVIQEIIVQPPEIMVFGTSATRHEIDVIDVRGKPLHVVRVEASSPYMQAAVQPEKRVAADHIVCPISLEIGANLPQGRHDEHVTIYTDDPQYRELKVLVTAVRRPRQRFTATPPEVALYASSGEPTVGRVIVLRDQQGQPVAIEEVRAEDPSIRCEWSKEPSAVGTVKVTVQCDKVRSLTLESKIHVRFRSGESLTIPVSCTGR